MAQQPAVQPAAAPAGANPQAAIAALCEQVIAANNAFHGSDNNDVKQKADKWLSEFATKVEAWQVCDQLLSRPNQTPQLYFYAANTLRYKVFYDFEELKQLPMRAAFREALLTQLKRFKTDKLIRERLAVAVACLAVVMNEWTGEALQTLTKHFAADGSTALCLLDVLTFLPEEVANEEMNVSAAQRQSAGATFASYGKTLLNMLWMYHNSTQVKSLQCKVLKCFYTWVRHGGISVDDVPASPLFGATFDGMAHPDTFETCVDVILCLIRASGDIVQHQNLVKAVVPRVLALGPLFDKMVKAEDWESVLNLQRIFVDLGELYLPLILEGSPAALQTLELILKCTAVRESHISTSTYRISSNTFNFWFVLSREITKALPDVQQPTRSYAATHPQHVALVRQAHAAAIAAQTSAQADFKAAHAAGQAAGAGAGAQPSAATQAAAAQAQASIAAVTAAGALPVPPWMDPTVHTFAQIKQQKMFASVFARLILTLKETLRYPPEYDSWNAEKKDDSKGYRHSAQDVLLDATYVVGPRPSLALVWENAGRDFASYRENPAKNWHMLEASLYCIRSIARVVERDEHEILPKVMTLLPQLVGPSGLRYTANLIVARYADWLNTHPFFLEGLLKYVVAGLADKDLVSSSALAFKHACDGCAQHLSSKFLEQSFLVYGAIKPLVLADQKEIIEGMCCVVGCLPAAENKLAAGVHRLLLPIVTELNTIVGTNIEGNPQAKEAATLALAPCLDRLAEVYRCLNPALNPDPNAIGLAAVAMLQKMWPLMEATIAKWKESDRIMERLTRVWKYCIKSAKTNFAPLLSQMITLLARFYQASPHSSFLYLASITVDTFCDLEQYHKMLGDIYQFFSQKTFMLLKDSQAFVNNPDIVEDYFEMIARFVTRTPTIVFGPHPNPPPAYATLIGPVFQCGLLGLGLQHRQPLSAVCNFFCTFLASATAADTPGNSKRRAGNKPTAAQAAIVFAALKAHGQTLVNALIRSVTGDVPVERNQLLITVFFELITLCGAGAQPWFANALTKVPDTQYPTKAEFLAQLFRAQDGRALKEVVQSYSRAVRKLSRI